MFEQSEEIARLADTVYVAFDELERGDTLANGTIEAIIGILPNEGRWQTIVRKARRRLEDEREIVTRWDRDIGCRLLTVDQQLDSNYRQRRARRQIKMGIREIKAMSKTTLSLHQRRVQAARIDSLRAESRAISAAMRQDKVLFGKTQTLPMAIAGRE